MKKVTESIEGFRDRQRTAMNDFFNDDPFASESDKAAKLAGVVPEADARSNPLNWQR